MLLDKGTKLETIVQNRTPLSVAKQRGDPKIISLLESHIRIDIHHVQLKPSKWFLPALGRLIC
jgi:hypothetical protein